MDCSQAEDLYSLNDEIAAEREANSPGAGQGSYGAPGAGGRRGGGSSSAGAGGGYSSPADLAREAGGIQPQGQYGGK